MERIEGSKYLYIFLDRHFGKVEITKKLAKIIFYARSCVRSQSEHLIFPFRHGVPTSPRHQANGSIVGEYGGQQYILRSSG
jgi:hypothetical protein